MIAIFDLDDTLVDREAAMTKWCLLLLEHERLPSDLVGLVLELDDSGQKPRVEFFEDVVQTLHLPESSAVIKRFYEATYIDCYGPEPESAEALQILRSAGWKIGVITNGPACRQHTKIDRAGLRLLIDGICVGEEIGVGKPQAEIFIEVARRCGSPLEGWMIGDSPDEDVEGGARVGLKTVWLRRGRDWDSDERQPDVVADSVMDAVNAVLRVS